MSEDIALEYSLTQHVKITARKPPGHPWADGTDEAVIQYHQAFEERVLSAILSHQPLLDAVCEYTVIMTMSDPDFYLDEGEDDILTRIFIQFIDCFIEEDQKAIRQSACEDITFFDFLSDCFQGAPSGYHINRHEIRPQVHEEVKKVRHHKKRTRR